MYPCPYCHVWWKQKGNLYGGMNSEVARNSSLGNFHHRVYIASLQSRYHPLFTPHRIYATMESTEVPRESSRSPSPPTHPPTQATPGPRASALQKLYSDAIAHLLKTISYANFSACFPTAAARVPASLLALHTEFTTKLGTQLHEHFSTILEERNVVRSLNELDTLVDEARRKREKAGEGAVAVAGNMVPAKQVPAKQLYLAHLAPGLREQSVRLRERQEVVQRENVEVLGRVLRQRREVAELVRGLEGVVGDLEGCVKALEGDEGMMGLGEVVGEVDVEMRGNA